jgi:hypothetical protein
MDTTDIKPIALREIKEGSLESILMGIIDDIDTAGDMFKPEIDNYFRFIQSKIELASKLIVSDGYKLYYTEQYKTRQA